jgi:hypothetical protein
MDDTINPGAGSDTNAANVEIPVNVDTLTIDGTTPAVGDMVKLAIRGPVTRVVNAIAYVKPETVNDQPMPAPALEPDPMEGEGERLRQLSQSVGQIPNY